MGNMGIRYLPYRRLQLAPNDCDDPLLAQVPLARGTWRGYLAGELPSCWPGPAITTLLS